MIDRERLAEENLRLVRYAVSRMRDVLRRVGIDEDEAYSEGLVGYAQAVLSYDPARARFSTYAVACIQSELAMMIRTYTRKKRLGSTIQLDDRRIVLQQSEPGDHLDEWVYLNSLTGRDAVLVRLRMHGWTEQEIARYLGTHQVYVSRLLGRIRRGWRERMGETG